MPDTPAPSAFDAIKAISYTVVIVRDMAAMRDFYEQVLGFSLTRALSENWLEYKIGSTILALSAPGFTANDLQTPQGNGAMQLAFEVDVASVDACAAELTDNGIPILAPPTNQPFGHRTLFFRDPDGNLIEIYAEIDV